VLGARFRTDDNVDGVVVEELASDSPAQKAGLLANDVILTVNNVGVAGTAGLKRIMASHRPGDVVTVRYSRNGREAECQVCLASRRHVQMNWDGEDFANHGTSLRTDNFPDVIQHDLPLNPEDMGGAAFDLHGRAVALNIARVNRVTNFALPLESFLPDLTRWMQEDRARR
jgi:S1-C subfamily serine protease